MPTYEYLCPTHGEFEEVHSIKIKLQFCPQCKEGGKEEPVKRLISLGGKGVVELTGQDLINKVKSDTVKLKKDIHKSEALYANALGEAKYQALQQKIDSSRQDRKNR